MIPIAIKLRKLMISRVFLLCMAMSGVTETFAQGYRIEALGRMK